MRKMFLRAAEILFLGILAFFFFAGVKSVKAVDDIPCVTPTAVEAVGEEVNAPIDDGGVFTITVGYASTPQYCELTTDWVVNGAKRLEVGQVLWILKLYVNETNQAGMRRLANAEIHIPVGKDLGNNNYQFGPTYPDTLQRLGYWSQFDGKIYPSQKVRELAEAFAIQFAMIVRLHGVPAEVFAIPTLRLVILDESVDGIVYYDPTVSCEAGGVNSAYVVVGTYNGSSFEEEAIEMLSALAEQTFKLFSVHRGQSVQPDTDSDLPLYMEPAEAWGEYHRNLIVSLLAESGSASKGFEVLFKHSLLNPFDQAHLRNLAAKEVDQAITKWSGKWAENTLNQDASMYFAALQVYVGTYNLESVFRDFIVLCFEPTTKALLRKTGQTGEVTFQQLVAFQVAACLEQGTNRFLGLWIEGFINKCQLLTVPDKEIILSPGKYQCAYYSTDMLKTHMYEVTTPRLKNGDQGEEVFLFTAVKAEKAGGEVIRLTIVNQVSQNTRIWNASEGPFWLFGSLGKIVCFGNLNRSSTFGFKTTVLLPMPNKLYLPVARR